MKAVMISIRKEHSDKIFSGVKKWEGRKTRPAIVKIWNSIDSRCDYRPSSSDITFYVYESKLGGGCGKVVGEFACDFAHSFSANSANWSEIAEALCVDVDFVHKYFTRKYGYMIRVCNPVKYDIPKELSEFETIIVIPEGTQWFGNMYSYKHIFNKKLTRPPLSWCYVEV